MREKPRRPAVPLALLAVVAVSGVAAGCGDDDPGPATEPVVTDTTVTTTTTTEPEPTETQTTTEEPAPAPTVVRINVVDGAPRGGIVRAEVAQEDRVVLVVTSDAADEVHVHGYDVSRRVTAGGTARLPFRATLPGRFEVELEERGVPIAEITVQP